MLFSVEAGTGGVAGESVRGDRLARDMQLWDWRAIACKCLDQSHLMYDGIHFKPDYYSLFANALLAGDLVDPCTSRRPRGLGHVRTATSTLKPRGFGKSVKTNTATTFFFLPFSPF